MSDLEFKIVFDKTLELQEKLALSKIAIKRNIEYIASTTKQLKKYEDLLKKKQSLLNIVKTNLERERNNTKAANEAFNKALALYLSNDNIDHSIYKKAISELLLDLLLNDLISFDGKKKIPLLRIMKNKMGITIKEAHLIVSEIMLKSNKLTDSFLCTNSAPLFPKIVAPTASNNNSNNLPTKEEFNKEIEKKENRD